MSLTAKDAFYNYITQYCQSQWLHDLQHKLSVTTRPLVPRNNRLLNRQQNADPANIIINIIIKYTNKKSSSTSHNLLFLLLASYFLYS